MKTLSIFGIVVIASTMMWCQALAQPKNGFGVFGGFANHSADGNFTVSPNTSFSYSSSGLGFGIDYQFALEENFSINPFFSSSSEGTSGDLATGVVAGHGILGIQMRFWMDDLFLGGHVGSYSEVLSGAPAGDTSANGSGFGIVAGLQQESGIFVSVQYDSFTVKYSDANVDLTGFRINVGFRFGEGGDNSGRVSKEETLAPLQGAYDQPNRNLIQQLQFLAKKNLFADEGFIIGNAKHPYWESCFPGVGFYIICTDPLESKISTLDFENLKAVKFEKFTREQAIIRVNNRSYSGIFVRLKRSLFSADYFIRCSRFHYKKPESIDKCVKIKSEFTHLLNLREREIN